MELAGRLGKTVRQVDRLARFGGEEFVVVAPGIGLEAATELAERLRRAVAETDFAVVGRVTISIGVAALRRGEAAETMTWADWCSTAACRGIWPISWPGPGPREGFCARPSAGPWATTMLADLSRLTAEHLSPQQLAQAAATVPIALPGGEVVFTEDELSVRQALSGGKNLYVVEYDLIHDVQARGKTPLDIISTMAA